MADYSGGTPQRVVLRLLVEFWLHNLCDIGVCRHLGKVGKSFSKSIQNSKKSSMPCFEKMGLLSRSGFSNGHDGTSMKRSSSDSSSTAQRRTKGDEHG